MADKHLVSISALQISAARWQGGRLGPCTVFENNEAGLAAFKDHLEQSSRLPVHIMVDAVEEDYRFESLPHSFGSDRNEMIARKLKQHYRSTQYCSARMQGRDTGKRRDDRYLFCALTNPELINTWLQVVTALELPVAGIYLLPTVSAMLVDKLKSKQTNLLVVSVHGAGLRLSFLREQQLRISRLARIDGNAGEAIKNYAEEISNTRLYLHALRVMTLDEHLSVLVVDRNDTLGGLEQTIARDNPNIECRRLGKAEILSSLSITSPVMESSSDALYLHLLGLRAPDNNLAPANVTLGYRQHQIRRGIYALSAVTALAAAAWCALSAYQIFDSRIETENARRQTAELQAKYQEATRQFPAAPTTAENLRRAVEVSQKIGATTRTPDIMMDLVSQSLERNPAIVMKSFEWKYDTAEFATAREASPGQSSAPAFVPPPVSQGGGKRKEGALIEGEVRPFRGDYRAAIDSINRFADSLAQQPNVGEVKVIKLPLNISPGLTLSGNTTDSRDQSDRAEFVLVVYMKPAV
ncbi:MAG: hypothetical protein JWN94_4793 [Betaproteobacteria bacterium]|nr:hypothetical protein [Betaproteobacteria bacterium]